MALTRRVIVVGVGSIGRRHARLLRERPDLRVEVCEPSPQAFAVASREFGDLPNHPSFEAALASGPDMMVVATPHAFHRAQAIAALKAGVHVLCEKPMSDNLADAQAMRAVAESAKTVFTVGFQLHFYPGVRRIKELIAQGALGTVLYAHFHVGTYVTLVNSLSRYQRHTAGALLLDYVHQPDFFHWLLGCRPAGVYMAGGQGGRLELTSTPNFVSIVCDYARPLLTSIHLNYLQMPDRAECEIVGDRGWLLWNLHTGCLRLGTAATGTVTEESHAVVRDDTYRQEHQAFLDAIDGRRAPESPAADAIVSMEVADAALRSWKAQCRVALG